MKTYCKLEISFDANVKTFNKVSEILGVSPTDTDFSSFPNGIPAEWTYEVIVKEDDPYFDFINTFLDLLESKYKTLEQLHINRSDITFWYLYEYDRQCNMEFDSVRLKRLGDNGITLCISCWDSGNEYNMTDEQGTGNKI